MDYIQIVLTLIAVFGPAIGGVLVSYLKAHNVNTAYYEALGRAGAVALQSLQISGKPVTDKTAVAAAAIEGIKYLGTHAAETVAVKVPDPSDLVSIVGAELTRQAYAGLAAATMPRQ